MQKISINKKTGFTTLWPFVIFDKNKVLFYSSNFTDKIKKGERLNFNLPPGVFYYEGSFRKLDFPVKQKEIKLPKSERNIPIRQYKILFKENPNKCSINYAMGVIIFDNKFKTAPMYEKYYIYFHEIGHHFYKSEHLADLYATKKMLEVGFNISQIGRVPITTLTQEDNLFRKINVLKSLKK